MRGTRALMEVKISYGFVSGLHIRYIGNIDHSQIHAHSAGYRRAFTSHQNLAAIRKQARIAIAIAYGQRPDETFALGYKSLAVADAGSARYFLEL
jgi:hypothetical protein